MKKAFALKITSLFAVLSLGLSVFAPGGIVALAEGQQDDYELPFIPSGNHTWDEGVITTPPTCTLPGKKTYTCLDDPTHTYTETIPATGHTAADMPVIENEVEATCTYEGIYDEVTYCTKCGAVIKRKHNITPIDESVHVFGEWVQTAAPSCTENGSKERTCSGCGKKETGVINALGHNYIAVVTAPTYTEFGYTTYTCSRCGDSYVDSYMPVLSLAGDIDGDNAVTDADAVYLLMHTFFPEDYPVTIECDFDGDGYVTDADAVYLLMYTFFPEDYPI